MKIEYKISSTDHLFIAGSAVNLYIEQECRGEKSFEFSRPKATFKVKKTKTGYKVEEA